jgi:fructose-specific component phosphotransferase system IIB-like protein
LWFWGGGRASSVVVLGEVVGAISVVVLGKCAWEKVDEAMATPACPKRFILKSLGFGFWGGGRLWFWGGGRASSVVVLGEVVGATSVVVLGKCAWEKVDEAMATPACPKRFILKSFGFWVLGFGFWVSGFGFWVLGRW